MRAGLSEGAGRPVIGSTMLPVLWGTQSRVLHAETLTEAWTPPLTPPPRSQRCMILPEVRNFAGRLQAPRRGFSATTIWKLCLFRWSQAQDVSRAAAPALYSTRAWWVVCRCGHTPKGVPRILHNSLNAGSNRTPCPKQESMAEYSMRESHRERLTSVPR